MESKCSKLTSIDFDNDNVYFPIHHGKLAHWSLIRLKWTGEVWEVYYVDSLLCQDAGNIFCDAVTDMVKAHLMTYRTRFADAAHISGRKRVKFSRDNGMNAKRASASFVRVIVASEKQKDLFNCGCFMLHNIECAIINKPDWTSFPSSTVYFAAYRRRMLLTIMTFDGE
jgi:Ulp1 family protease